MLPMNPFDLIDDYARSMQRREKTSHYASQIISCPRASWFAFKGIKPSNPINVASLFKMQVGTAIGEIKTRALDQGLQLWFERHPEHSFAPLSEVLEETCPLMMADIREAAQREVRPFDMNTLTPFTVSEVPFRMEIPGLKYPLSGRIDSVGNFPYFVKHGELGPGTIALIMEDKSSSASSTRYIKEQQTTWITYQLQLFTYHHRYPELMAEINYIDREWGYPYRFGMITRETNVTELQPGGANTERKGTPISDSLKLAKGKMDPWQFIVARLKWMEELLESDTPPGERTERVIPAPHSRTGFKEIVEHKLALPDHPTILPEKDKYLIYLNPDGTMISSRGQTVDGVKYRSNTCHNFCQYRDLCLRGDGIKVVSEEDDFLNWGAE